MILKILHKEEHNSTQTYPRRMSVKISRFYAKLLSVRRRGDFQLGDTANIDQTPLPFVLDGGKTYDSTASKEVWSASAASASVMMYSSTESVR